MRQTADVGTTRVTKLPPEYEPPTEIPPGASRRIDFATGADLGDGVFFDRRLWQPGTYTIRLVFSNELSDPRIAKSGWVTGLKAAPLVTPPISLQVETPSGTDADAWQAVLQATTNRALLVNSPEAGAIGRELYERFPSSRYAPFFLQVVAMDVWRNGGETRFATVAAMNETIERLDKTGILAEDIRLGRAVIRAREALAQSDVDSAIRSTAAALEDLKTIERSTTHEQTRLKAQRAMRTVKTPEAIRDHFRAAAVALVCGIGLTVHLVDGRRGRRRSIA